MSFQHDYWGIPTTCGASNNYNRCMNIDLRQVCHPRSNWFIAGLGNNRFQSGEWWKPLRTFFFIQEVTIFALASQEMFFSKQDDEWWICVNDSRPCCGTWRMESWCPYCKCLKQRWPVTALSWKQKDIQRLQTSNRYTITKQGAYQTSSRYHDIRYHFSYKVHTYLYMKQFFEMFKSETCRKTFHISNISTLSKDQQKIS